GSSGSAPTQPRPTSTPLPPTRTRPPTEIATPTHTLPPTGTFTRTPTNTPVPATFTAAPTATPLPCEQVQTIILQTDKANVSSKTGGDANITAVAFDSNNRRVQGVNI